MFDKNRTIYNKLILQTLKNHLDSFPAKRNYHLSNEFASNQKRIEADTKKSNQIDIDDNRLFITNKEITNKISDPNKYYGNAYNGLDGYTRHVDP